MATTMPENRDDQDCFADIAALQVLIDVADFSREKGLISKGDFDQCRTATARMDSLIATWHGTARYNRVNRRASREAWGAPIPLLRETCSD